MQGSIAVLAKRAVSTAIKEKWEEAIKLNLQILNKKPGDLDAKVRLGRAYIQTKNFDKAKKIFKEVLKQDPINKIAKKNLDLANKEKVEKLGNGVNTKALLKEPGTTSEAVIQITGRGLSSKNFAPGEELSLKIKKRSADIFKDKEGEKILIGIIDQEDTLKRLNIAEKRNFSISASYIKGKDKEITILLKCSNPVFKPEKQDIRPYIKKGSIEEPEIEIPIEEES